MLWNLQTDHVFCFNDLAVTSDPPNSPPLSDCTQSFGSLQTFAFVLQVFYERSLVHVFNISPCFVQLWLEFKQFCEDQSELTGMEAVAGKCTTKQHIGLFGMLSSGL